jgi:hypothetical protein
MVAALAALVVSYVAMGSGGPVAAAPPDVFVFGRGTDDAIWYRARQDGAWRPWQSIGGIAAEAPAAVAYPDGGVGVFVRGRDGALWQNESLDGVSWRGWTSLGGQASGTAVAARDRFGPPGASDVYLVTRGADRRAWIRRFGSDTATWTAWAGPFGDPADGAFVAAPAGISAVAYSVGRDGEVDGLDIAPDGSSAAPFPVFGPVGALRLGLMRDLLAARGANGELVVHSDAEGTQSMGGQLVGGPAAGRNDDELIYVMGTDRAVWTAGCCGQGWRSLGGSVLEAPGAVEAPGGDVLAARGYDASLWVRTSAAPSGQLGPWTPLGGVLKDVPVVVTMLV